MHDKLILDNKFFSFPKQSVKRYVICTGRIYKMPFSMFVSGLYFFVCILYYTKKNNKGEKMWNTNRTRKV